MEAFGLPEDQEFGVLNHSGSDSGVFATIIRRTRTAVPSLAAGSREVASVPVERVSVYPVGIRPSQEVLETYAGPAGGIEQVAAFLAGSLALPVVVENIELDIPAAVEKLAKLVQKCNLRSVRVKDYAHNSYMAGPYAPKFLDPEHGKDFLDEYAQEIVGAGVSFAAPSGRATVTLTPKACFTFSCHDDDRTVVQSILRKLA
jgi:hypothetical protein